MAIGTTPGLDPSDKDYAVRAVPTLCDLVRVWLCDWKAAGAKDETLPFEFTLGSFITNQGSAKPRAGGHGEGQRFDLNAKDGSFDATTPGSVSALVDQLGRLPAGTLVDVGLPLLDPNFFPATALAEAQRTAITDSVAKLRADPAALAAQKGPVVSGDFVKLFKTSAYRYVWDPGKQAPDQVEVVLDVEVQKKRAIDFIVDAALQTALKACVTVNSVFPDNRNHVHITVLSGATPPAASETPT